MNKTSRLIDFPRTSKLKYKQKQIYNKKNYLQNKSQGLYVI